MCSSVLNKNDMIPANSQNRPDKPQKTLARLLPAPTSELDDSRPHISDSTSTLSKRPRIGVPIACNFCRLKKTRCDGGKPACRSCTRKGHECIYEDPNVKGSRNGDMLLEAVWLLNTLTPAQATATLSSVAGHHDSADVMTTIRQAADVAAQQLDSSLGLIGGPSSFTRELTARHPFTYPGDQGIGPEAAEELLKDLLSSTRAKRQPVDIDNSRMSRPRENYPDGVGPESLSLPQPEIPDLDPELEGLRIGRWTVVDVSDDFAASAISLYLATDHKLLAPFHRGLFLKDLVSVDETAGYCSSAMVNALLYWCCQMYSSIEINANFKTELFRMEAERQLTLELESPQSTTMVAAMFLSLGHLVQGKDHAVLRHLSEAAEIGVQLGLFGVPEATAEATKARLTPTEATALAYPSWGVFNWTVLMTLFYRQQNVPNLQHPPVLDVPNSERPSRADEDHTRLEMQMGGQLPSVSHTGDTFVALCHFWRVMYDVAAVYYSANGQSERQPLTLQFAEFKFRELLAWTDELPLTLARSGSNPHYVVILHLWLHSAILDIFRPFLQGDAPRKHRLRTFAPPLNTPDAAYAASVEQLKRLIVTYRSKYPASHYTIIWQTSLLYTANAMLHSTAEDRLTYFLICLYSYADMRQSFRVTEAIVRALLSMGMQNGVITGPVARRVLQDLRRTAPQADGDADEMIRAPFIADLEQALLAPDSATVEAHAAQFEENAMLRDYTSLFDLE